MNKVEEIKSKTVSPDKRKYVVIVRIREVNEQKKQIEDEWLYADEENEEWYFRLIDAATSKLISDGYIGSLPLLDSISASVMWAPDSKKFAILREKHGHDCIETGSESFKTFPFTSTDLHVWSSSERKKLLSLSWDTDWVAASWSPNGQLLAVSEYDGYDGTIEIHDVQSGKKLTTLNTVGDIDSWSEDGKHTITKENGKSHVYTPFPDDDYSEPYYDRYNTYDDRYDDSRRTSAGIPSLAQDFIPPPDYPGWM